MLPKPNELPTTTYEAKKIVCPLGLQIEKIHACRNDCILYRSVHENLDECPVCHASRYKILRDDPGDVDDKERPKKRIPVILGIVDLNNIGYRNDPFVLATDVNQVFYVKDMSIKPKRGNTRREKKPTSQSAT
jgi:hypothetical protein